MLEIISFKEDHIEIIDQTKLPVKIEILKIYNLDALILAIKKLAVRGAPALGIAAAFGLALAAFYSKSKNSKELIQELNQSARKLKAARPTAVNLFWAIDEILNLIKENHLSPEILKLKVIQKASLIAKEEKERCYKISKLGAGLIKDNDRILTHCNTGILATGGYGTALGVIKSAFHQGKKVHVYVDETRPLLQGSRLTAWELKEEKIPYTLITDSMAGVLMRQKKINLIIVGADRIAGNGDTANKIGTYSLAVLAKAHKIPFYIAAPYSTIDIKLKNGHDIPIEERDPDEILKIKGILIAPLNSAVYNPAFDITPQKYITAIITEKGIIYHPFFKNKELLKN